MQHWLNKGGYIERVGVGQADSHPLLFTVSLIALVVWCDLKCQGQVFAIRLDPESSPRMRMLGSVSRETIDNAECKIGLRVLFTLDKVE